MSHYQVGYDWRIFELIPDNSRVLDVGFGYGMWGYELKVRRKVNNIIGIEPYKPYYDLVKSFNVYDVVIHENVFNIPDKNFDVDVVLCCDVIEHIKKKKSDVFIRKLESWGRKIIIATPNGNMLNDYAQDGNELNKHLSHYDGEFFEYRGYKVEIVRYYPDAPKIFRPFIRFYNKIWGNDGIESCIIAVKEKC